MSVEELMQKLKQIFALISCLQVSGDAVDTVAQTRALLREIYKEVKNSAGNDS